MQMPLQQMDFVREKIASLTNGIGKTEYPPVEE
jgi:hypothetical protein